MEGSEPQVAVLLIAGVVAGLWLLARGMDGYRTAVRIGDTGTSRIATMAAGEVRVSGRIETAEVLLISSLQRAPCVYYRSTIENGDDDVDGSDDLVEERAIGFRVVDESGDVRVFPRGARWDAPVCFDDRTGTFGEEPAGLSMRTGSGVAPAEIDRETAIAALLTGRPTAGVENEDVGGGSLLGGFSGGAARRRRRYREARLAPGDAVTIVGRAIPFSDLADPTEADEASGSGVAADDQEIEADLAEARAAGLLADDPEEAWGNAAIPGFGVGRPVRAPELDPGADALLLGSAEEAARIERRFAIAPNTLVLASAPDVPLADRPRGSRSRGGSAPGPVHHGIAGGGAGHRIGDRACARAYSRVRVMTPVSLAAVFAVGLLLVIVAFIVVASYNAVMALRQRIDKAWSNIDVALKQRHDQLPALVAAVRGAMAFEQGVLAEVTRARAAYSPTEPIPTQAVHAEATSAAVRSLFAVVEAYPAVKSQQNVLDFQDEIERLEAMIADRRELYNDQVYRYNTRISTIPTLPLARVFGWTAREFFAAGPQETARPEAAL